MFEYFNGILLGNVQFIGQEREGAYTIFCVEIVILVLIVRYKLCFYVLGEIAMDKRIDKLPAPWLDDYEEKRKTSCSCIQLNEVFSKHRK